MASDSDSDEDFVTFGTPLEPLEEDEPLRKPIPVHEQTVKDEKGRYQRFHGAFTGGFSAGYYNTVGTKEGWTPSMFVSSRQQKAERQNARPEDFMDEEDMGEHGIAPKEITTTADFASGRKDLIRDKAKTISAMSALIPGDPVLEDLVTPARSSIGVELLRKMGWKDGQGVGPRVKRRPRKQKEDRATRALGSVLPPSGSEDSQDEEDEFVPENVTFAPKDVTPIDFTPKVDLHGLGYQGLNPLAALRGAPGAGHINLFTMDSDRASSLCGNDRKGPKRRQGGVAGQAFGVGAMEDDDDDIYHRDTMSNYDMVLGGEEPGDGLYGWTAPEQYHRKKRDHSKDAAYLGKIIEGFTLASDKTETKMIFPPPDLPRDFRPVHYFRPVVDMSTVSPMVAKALQASRGHMVEENPSQGGRHQLDSVQRRQLLGETTLQGPSSVFDLLKAEDRERLSGLRRPPPGPMQPSEAPPRQPTLGEARAAVVAAGVAAAKASAQKALSSRFAPPAEQQQLEALSAWSGPTAQAQTGKAFKPFEKTPHKQARYDQYIEKLKQGDRDALELSLDPSMTEWERGRERDEFVRAALLYKPSSSSLSGRFTRGKHDDSVDDNTVEVTRDVENDVDDKQAAVKMKMFGKLTRDTFEWHPDKLLCKRFNVPDPYPGSGFVGLPTVKRDKFSVFNFLTLDSSPTAAASPAPQALKAPVPGKRSRWDVSGPAGAGLSEEKQVQDPLSEFLSVARSEASGCGPDPSTNSMPSSDSTAEPEEADTKKTDEDEKQEQETRPPMDLFKAIFASSSDESSSSEGEDEEEDDEAGQTKAEDPLLHPLNASQAAPPAAGMSPANQSGPAASASAPAGQDILEKEFGPRLPPPYSPTSPSEDRPTSAPSRKEDKPRKSKEKHKARKHGKNKKDKKQKKKHKRHKHKGKKKSSRKTESSGSSSEGGDGNSQEGGQVSTEELLRRLKSIQGKPLQ